MRYLGNKSPASPRCCHVAVGAKCISLRVGDRWINPIHAIPLTFPFKQYFKAGLPWWWVVNLSPWDSLQFSPLLPAADAELRRCFFVPQFAFKSSIARFRCSVAKNWCHSFSATVRTAVSLLSLTKGKRQKYQPPCLRNITLVFVLLLRSPISV